MNNRLDHIELHRLDTDGYVVRERVFTPSEVQNLADACEKMVERVVRAVNHAKHSPKTTAGNYLFQTNRDLCTVVKWEPEYPDEVQGVEPFAHFDAALNAWGNDRRLTAPMLDLLGVDAVGLFTEKLNLKRRLVGGPIVLHQDFPYWTENSDDAGEIATAVIFLDDANVENGCIEVLPGSHRLGSRKRKDVSGFGTFEMDEAGFDASDLTTVEVPAGSVVFFGSYLVHRSLPNRSAQDRRALLYSYQPRGRPRSCDFLANKLKAELPAPGRSTG